MRIALVCPYSFDTPGGVATHVRGLASWLRGEGHDVAVLAPGTGPAAPGEYLLGGSRAFRFNGSTAQLALDPRQCRIARAMIADADVVHVHEPLTPGLAYSTARAASSLVVTHHASFTPRFLVPILRARNALLRPASRIAVSPSAALTARAATGALPDIIPNGITLPEPNDVPRAAPPVVLFIGRRDDPRKGYALFEAVARHCQEPVRFVALGPGSRRSDVVIELGEVSDADLHSWLAQSTVLVAAHTGGESFGLVLVEALAHGVTVAASDLPAFRSVAGDSPAVRWFPAQHLEAAIAALHDALHRPAERYEAVAVARRYSWEHVGPRILAHYEQAVRR